MRAALVGLVLVSCLSFRPRAHGAGFDVLTPGEYDYETPGNWASGTINGVFNHPLTGSQVIKFNANHPLSTGLTFNLLGTSP
ncbi:MAG TPA: hypothetical protein VEQ65_06405, partial [Opitutus sp.]|nr:hypothetical protein [Opitutus sp.]